MKTWKLLLSLLVALSLIASACGGSDGDDDAADSSDSTTEVEASDDGDAMDDDEGEDHSDDAMEDDAMEDDAMEDDAMDDDAMEDDAMDDGETAMADGDCAAPVNNGAGEGGDLTLLQWQAPSQANAHLSSGTKDVLASSLVLEPLANIGPDGEIVPRLAAAIPTIENGGISEDLTTITWTLQDCIMWSDGTQLSADDVVFTWEYCADELTGCTTADSIGAVSKVVAIDDLTVEITFDAPTPYPFEPFVGHGTPILQRAQFSACVGEGSAACSDQNFMPIGTGPFMITALSPEDIVVAEINPMYRGVSEGKPFFSDVVIQGGGDAESAARSVAIGEADYAWNMQISPDVLGTIITDDSAAGLKLSFTSSVEHININQTNNRAEGDDASNYPGNPHPILFQNLELVEALSLAIDRDLIVEIGYGDAAIPTCNMWNVGVQNSTNLNWCLTQDIDRANQILDDAGYADTDGDGIRETPDGLPLSFTYATSVNAVRQSTQDIVKSNWSEIGVDVEMQAVEASIFFDGTNADQSIWRFPTDMEMFTNLPGSPAPEPYLGGWTTENIPTLETAWGGSNIPRLQSEEFDDIISQLEQTPMSDPVRNDLAIRANDILSFEGGAVIPLALRGSLSAASNEIQNIGDLNGWDSEYWNIADWTRG